MGSGLPETRERDWQIILASHAILDIVKLISVCQQDSFVSRRARVIPEMLWTWPRKTIPKVNWTSPAKDIKTRY